MRVDKKKSGLHAKRRGPILGKVLCTLALFGCLAALLYNSAQNVQLSRDKNAALLLDNLTLQRQNRETGDALEQSQNRTQSLEAQVAKLQQQLSELQNDLAVADKTQTGLREDLFVAQSELSDTKLTLEITQEALNEMSAQCGSILRPTPDQQEYQALYPDLYVEAPEAQYAASGKVVYLTFDDGPSAVTDSILKTLDKYGIKATFFVVPDGSAASNARLKAIADAGHTIGIHTTSHVYTTIYASVEAYLKDFELAFRRVEAATGIRCEIFRFPGGSVNSYNRGVYQPIIAEMLRRGFTYYDWNASNDDSAGQTTVSGIVNRAIETTTANRAILLCHDAPARTATATALPTIIEKLQAKGYRFEKLDKTVLPVTFAYK